VDIAHPAPAPFLSVIRLTRIITPKSLTERRARNAVYGTISAKRSTNSALGLPSRRNQKMKERTKNTAIHEAAIKKPQIAALSGSGSGASARRSTGMKGPSLIAAVFTAAA
jgi:hypothetical protein